MSVQRVVGRWSQAMVKLFACHTSAPPSAPRRPRPAAAAQEEIGEPAGQEQVQPGRPGEGEGGRKNPEEQAERIEDGGLAIGDKGRAAELIGVPQRHVPGAQRFRRELPPGVILRDAVPDEGVPGCLWRVGQLRRARAQIAPGGRRAGRHGSAPARARAGASGSRATRARPRGGRVKEGLGVGQGLAGNRGLQA